MKEIGDKNLLCKLGLHNTRGSYGSVPLVICERCKKVIKKNPIFSKENFIVLTIIFVALMLLWIVGVMKGCFNI
jgi:hypothetical protein